MEAGFQELHSVVDKNRAAFLKSKLTNPDPDEPFVKVYKLCQRNNTPGYRLCERSRNLTSDVTSLADKCRRYAATRTKFDTYLQINPQLCVNPMYLDSYLPEHHRNAATRFRLSSHNLLVERLRWSRVPRELRVCPCDNTTIQDEYHIFNDCSITEGLRNSISNTPFPLMLDAIFSEGLERRVCAYIYDISKCY